jgi:cyclase
LINEAAGRFGSQCIVAAVDAKRNGNRWTVFISGGSKDTGKDALEWIREVERRGAGEILLTSMDRDGTQKGFDLQLLKEVNEFATIPVIASGGAGNKQHCVDAIKIGGADAVLAASIFHFQTISIKGLKEELKRAQIAVREIY